MLTFVNINGEQIIPSHMPNKLVSRASVRGEYHKVFRAEGIPPGSLEAAAAAHEKERHERPFDPSNWLMNAKAKPIRLKPYEIESSALYACLLAERNGWLRTRVVAVKREAA